jgi:hypothetical protein
LANGSAKTVAASSNVTPCFSLLAFAFARLGTLHREAAELHAFQSNPKSRFGPSARCSATGWSSEPVPLVAAGPWP